MTAPIRWWTVKVTARVRASSVRDALALAPRVLLSAVADGRVGAEVDYGPPGGLAVTNDDDGPDFCPEHVSSVCWEECPDCGGEGTDGSACWDDMCHGGECIHGDDMGFLTCHRCDGRGGWWACLSGHVVEAPP